MLFDYVTWCKSLLNISPCASFHQTKMKCNVVIHTLQQVFFYVQHVTNFVTNKNSFYMSRIIIYLDHKTITSLCDGDKISKHHVFAISQVEELLFWQINFVKTNFMLFKGFLIRHNRIKLQEVSLYDDPVSKAISSGISIT